MTFKRYYSLEMVQSILDDIKAQFAHGNKITQIILVNVFVFLVLVIVRAFSPPETGIYKFFLENLALSSDGWTLLRKPWTILSHMFLHEGLWHMGWNMLMLYWFGRIVGDLAGDRRILPLYLLGGLAGALFYSIYTQIAGINGGLALGASGAVMAFVVAAGFLAPEYNMRLILLGNVRLKYIAAALVAIDLIMLSENNNPGGRFAHIGGAVLGGFFVHMLRQGVDITRVFQRGNDLFSGASAARRVPMKVIHNKKRPKSRNRDTAPQQNTQERIDEILDKINATGYESLTPEEKDFLYQASKKS